MDSTPERGRLFLALWPSHEQRRLIANHVATWRGREAGHWYASQDWHVTLWFLGDVDRDRWGGLGQQFVVPFQPFALCLDLPQRWPHGLAVLTASEVPQPLVALREGLGQRVAAASLPVEARPYRPHVTLARRAPDAQPPDRVAPVRWDVDAYALVHSTGDARQRYDVVRRYGA